MYYYKHVLFSFLTTSNTLWAKLGGNHRPVLYYWQQQFSHFSPKTKMFNGHINSIYYEQLNKIQITVDLCVFFF